jgi:predicted phage terminase large subunit-like protein
MRSRMLARVPKVSRSGCNTVPSLRLFLLHVFRQRLNYPDLRRKVKEMAAVHRANKVLIEDKASGTQLIQDLKAEHLFGIVPYEPPSGTDKIMRLHAQTAWFENGLVLLPREASWLSEFVRELTGFPGTKFDDQVDSTTQALDHLKPFSSGEVWARLGSTIDILI